MSHIYCKCGNISETVPPDSLVTTDHCNLKRYMTYQIAQFQ